MTLKLAITTAALTLAAAPALATPPERAQAPAGAEPQAGKARAYGRYCQAQSKKKVEGQRRTPFSQCVRAMAQLAGDDSPSPRAACKDLSRKRVEGQRATPFSLCVKGGRELVEDTTGA